MSYTDESAGTKVPVTIGNGSVTAANAEVLATFDSRVRHYTIQNNSAQPIYIEADGTASLGSQEVYPGGQVQFFDEDCHILHIYCGTAGISINGATAAGIVLRGRQ